MGILRSVTEGIDPYSLNGGFKKGQMSIITGGRRTGKSYYAWMASMEINKLKFMTLNSSTVDGEPWYSLLVGSEAAPWLRTQDKSLVIEGQGTVLSGAAIFDVHEKIYSLMVLKWQ